MRHCVCTEWPNMNGRGVARRRLGCTQNTVKLSILRREALDREGKTWRARDAETQSTPTAFFMYKEQTLEAKPYTWAIVLHYGYEHISRVWSHKDFLMLIMIYRTGKPVRFGHYFDQPQGYITSYFLRMHSMSSLLLSRLQEASVSHKCYLGLKSLC